MSAIDETELDYFLSNGFLLLRNLVHPHLLDSYRNGLKRMIIARAYRVGVACRT